MGKKILLVQDTVYWGYPLEIFSRYNFSWQNVICHYYYCLFRHFQIVWSKKWWKKYLCPTFAKYIFFMKYSKFVGEKLGRFSPSIADLIPNCNINLDNNFRPPCIRLAPDVIAPSHGLHDPGLPDSGVRTAQTPSQHTCISAQGSHVSVQYGHGCAQCVYLSAGLGRKFVHAFF